MPKRSNDFQHLVALIQKSLAPANAQVTESAMLEGMREVDVLIEDSIGPYRIKIAVEAKDHRRRIDVTTIDALCGKYFGKHSQHVDKVVLVSKSGFSPAAIKAALTNSIELLTLKAAENADWFGKLSLPSRQLLQIRHPPHVAHLTVAPLPKGFTNESIRKEGWVCCACCGKKKHTLQCVANQVLRKALTEDKKIVSEIENHVAATRRFCGRLKASFEDTSFKVGDSEVFPLESIEFHVHAGSEEVPLEFCSYNLTGGDGPPSLLHHGRGKGRHSEVEILVQDGEKPKVTLSMKPSKQTEKKSRKRSGATHHPQV